ncbi:helix-turn-helix domain-containing protein [Kitasatospora sp. NPDC101183]|uniref:helix-turn-helix domain-containing protein n=1 Tax=Kitasatospora sp. NPDC101183 TaxID=3364100 RepID=UPI0038210BD6
MTGATEPQEDGGGEELAERLRELRAQTRKSLKELERITLVSDSSWSRYLAGRGLPPWAAVEALCREVGRDPGELRPLWEAVRDRSAPVAPAAEEEAGEEIGEEIGEEVEQEQVAPAPPRKRRRPRLALVLAAIGALAGVAAWITAAVDGGGGRAAERSSPPAGTAAAGRPPVVAPGSPSAVPGALRADAAVPDRYRTVIELAARRCTEPEITPSLLAAMLKAESNFDPDLRDPKADEYGIARWTPSVFNAWAVDGDGDGFKDYMDPADAIATMGLYTCWLDQRIKLSGLHSNLPGLIAAAYRTSDKAVTQAGGPPAGTEAYVAEVLRHQREFTAD